MSLNSPLHLLRQIKKPGAGTDTPPSFGLNPSLSPKTREGDSKCSERKKKYCSEELEKVCLGFMYASKFCYQQDLSGLFAAQNHMYVQELVGSLGGNTQEKNRSY